MLSCYYNVRKLCRFLIRAPVEYGYIIANSLYCNVIVKRAEQVFRPTQYVFLLTKLLVELVDIIYRYLRACLHVTHGGSPHLSCKRDQIKIGDYMDRWVTNLSGLPHLPGVPHLHENRPLLSTICPDVSSVILHSSARLLVAQFTCNFLRFPQISDHITTLTNLKKFNSFFKSAP